MSFYIQLYKDSKDQECVVIKSLRTHQTVYNKNLDYLNPNLVESIILKEYPIITMYNYFTFVSEDFKFRVPKSCKDISEYILSALNNQFSTPRYILDSVGDTWIKVISPQDPHDTITFRKED